MIAISCRLSSCRRSDTMTRNSSTLRAVGAVLLVLLQIMTGAVVSTMITVWLQVLVLPHASIACQVRVASKVLPQWPVTFVTVLTMDIVVLPLLSVAVGVSKLQATPSSTVLLVLLQTITGAVVSTIFTD